MICPCRWQCVILLSLLIIRLRHGWNAWGSWLGGRYRQVILPEGDLKNLSLNMLSDDKELKAMPKHSPRYQCIFEGDGRVECVRGLNEQAPSPHPSRRMVTHLGRAKLFKSKDENRKKRSTNLRVVSGEPTAFRSGFSSTVRVKLGLLLVEEVEVETSGKTKDSAPRSETESIVTRGLPQHKHEGSPGRDN